MLSSDTLNTAGFQIPQLVRDIESVVSIDSETAYALILNEMKINSSSRLGTSHGISNLLLLQTYTYKSYV